MNVLKSSQLLSNWSTTFIIYGSVLGVVSTLLTSAGMLGGVGFLLSASSTLPILLATSLSVQSGIISYGVATILFAFIQPSEMFAFPLTTGLLGIVIGLGFRFFQRVRYVTYVSGVCLTIGILFLIQVLQFPVLGPDITQLTWITILGILIFSFLYSWLWVYLSSIVRKKKKTAKQKAEIEI
ncbi:hypothetical protein FZW96_00180 [Bacillus sp. BGMRC 2118]|nr:hypothetical protein FZW96_00180 [Bacillus sp. BGMRC 2118]